MLLILLILIPFIGGLISFSLKENTTVKSVSLFFSLITFFVSIVTLFHSSVLEFSTNWLPQLGSSFSLRMDGISKLLCLLTSLSFPLIWIATNKNQYEKTNAFYGLMMMMEAGLLGVFLASDVLVFYFFWELALIPAYFLCSKWGGVNRIAASFKFFVYTFAGSLLLLCGILYLYTFTADHSFAAASFYAIKLTHQQQLIGFVLFFIAFAIKIPMFPFHTWQPDAYEQSPTPVTMILSGVMAKMGLFAIIRWLLPIFPIAISHYGSWILVLSVVGILYASLIAIKENDMKRLIAYSSIAHLGLMCAALFSQTQYGTEGAIIQMFNHGINVIGLWIVVNIIEQKTGTRKFSELGGLAKTAPTLAILFGIMVFANIALPLTNSFIGEFLMFLGLFEYNKWLAFFAGLSIILSAVYSLWMMQKVFFGPISEKASNMEKSNQGVNISLLVIAILVIILGVYPQPVLSLIESTIQIGIVK